MSLCCYSSAESKLLNPLQEIWDSTENLIAMSPANSTLGFQTLSSLNSPDYRRLIS